jgi:pimeloyl-ACP methyl ester carboxylesterase
MSIRSQPQTAAPSTWEYVPTRSINVGGTKFAYRELGPETGVPVIFLNHLFAELDRWDPRVVDGIASKRLVIVFDNRGIGASEGSTPNSVEAMAHDAIAFIRVLGFEQVDLGGFISQVIALEERLKERRHNRDKSVSPGALFAQLKAIRAWGRQTPDDLNRIRRPVLVANGDHDKMVPTSNAADMARRLPNAELVLYDDAGHGGIFQYHEEFVPKALAFLEA